MRRLLAWRHERRNRDPRSGVGYEPHIDRRHEENLTMQLTISALLLVRNVHYSAEPGVGLERANFRTDIGPGDVSIRSGAERLRTLERNAMARVLVIDNRPENRQALAELLKRARHDVQTAEDALEGLVRLRVVPADVVLSDIRLGAQGDGLSLLRMVKTELPHIAFILYSASPNVRDAVLAIKFGAEDYVEFPVDHDQILLSVENAVESRHERSIAVGAERFVSKVQHDIVAMSATMRAVLDWAARIGPKQLTALVEGETGTGKELVARALHNTSDRRTRPFVPVNCGAIPEALFEAELFGYRQGAFTDARRDKPGLVEIAHCGTLFLDEIGELPTTMQVRLLRVLEDGQIRRLGETKTTYVDVRVVAATNRDLREEMMLGHFRSDLFYRLNGAYCRIPPLRERLEDVEPLVDFWVPRIAQKLRSPVRGVTPRALSLLTTHSWPGNVRELRNVLEHAISLASGDKITEAEISSALGPVRVRTVAAPSSSFALGQVYAPERDRLLAALDRHHWKVGRAAASLGVSRSTFWRKLRQHDIRPREPQP
jgi:DNA-binding NtrC family response regulator